MREKNSRACVYAWVDNKRLVLGAGVRRLIHHYSQGWLVMPKDEETWTSSAVREKKRCKSFVWPWLPSPLWHSEMVFRQREESFVPAWHQHVCLEALVLLSCYNGLSEPDTGHVLPKPTQPNFSAVLFPAAVPQLLVQPNLRLSGHRGESVWISSETNAVS